MFYFQIFLAFGWLVFSCVIGLILCLFRWGDIDLDRDFARIFSWGVLRITRVTVQAKGLEKIEKPQPCVYVANHQSGFDMATFGTLFPKRTVVIGKKELLWIPFFGIYFIASGNILINRQRRLKAIAGLSQAAEAILNRKVSIWIFPEGTRNRLQEGLLPFKKGAFYMAIEAGVPIVPIVSSSLKTILPRRGCRLSGGIVRIKVLDPIPTQGLTPQDVDLLARQIREKMLAALSEN